MTSFSATATTYSRSAAPAAPSSFDPMTQTNLSAGGEKLASRRHHRLSSVLSGQRPGSDRQGRQRDYGAARIRGAACARDREPGLGILGVQIKREFTAIEFEHRARV